MISLLPVEQAELAHRGDGGESELVQSRGQDHVVGREKGREGGRAGSEVSSAAGVTVILAEMRVVGWRV